MVKYLDQLNETRVFDYKKKKKTIKKKKKKIKETNQKQLDLNQQ